MSLQTEVSNGYSSIWILSALAWVVTTCSHTASNGHLHHDMVKEIFQYGKGGQAIFPIWMTMAVATQSFATSVKLFDQAI